jgi:inner membrane protein
MTGKGHLIIGAIISLATFKMSSSLGAIGIITAIATIFGSTAPDWMEIRRGEKTLIPHRTITHWLPIWILLFVYSLSQFNPSIISFIADINDDLYLALTYKLNVIYSSILLGFSIGGLLHLLVDLPNPMGIPILSPMHRFSLNLWNSGQFEKTIIVLSVSFTLYCYDIHLLLN